MDNEALIAELTRERDELARERGALLALLSEALVRIENDWAQIDGEWGPTDGGLTGAIERGEEDLIPKLRAALAPRPKDMHDPDAPSVCCDGAWHGDRRGTDQCQAVGRNQDDPMAQPNEGIEDRKEPRQGQGRQQGSTRTTEGEEGMTHDTKAAEPALPEAAAHIYPSDLERFKRSETFADAYSIAVVNPDERSVPLVTLSDCIEYGRQCAALSASIQAPPMANERDAFEAWCLREGYSTQKIPNATCIDGHEVYADTRTHAAWWAWQARAASPAVERDAPTTDPSSDDLQYVHELLRWAYTKLHYRSFSSVEDALELDRIRMYLEHESVANQAPGEPT
jgi:hypothetical protein